MHFTYDIHPAQLESITISIVNNIIIHCQKKTILLLLLLLIPFIVAVADPDFLHGTICIARYICWKRFDIDFESLDMIVNRFLQINPWIQNYISNWWKYNLQKIFSLLSCSKEIMWRLFCFSNIVASGLILIQFRQKHTTW